ncbi:MAG: penicillin-binding transpeptidase domain-containing protein [Bacteroidia bacterium]
MRLILLMLLAFLGKAHAQQAHCKTCDARYDSILRAHHLRGGYLIYDEQKDELHTNHFDLLDTMLSPASTFKIYNALQALDNKILRDENDTLHWDGKKRMVDAWNRDLNLQEAFSTSAVWYFQEVARKTGKERVEAVLNKLDYGNKSAAGAIDSFWLNGTLRISGRQQLDLLRRLYHEQLPFGKESQQTVKRIMKNAEPNLYGKTGWGMWQGKDLGWFIGWMEHKDKPVFFVHILISDALPDDEFGQLRRSMILEQIKFRLEN